MSGEKTPKGYLREQFSDAFSRYCSANPSQSATDATGLKSKEFNDNETATDQGELRFENEDNVSKSNDVAGVADSSLLYD